MANIPGGGGGGPPGDRVLESDAPPPPSTLHQHLQSFSILAFVCGKFNDLRGMWFEATRNMSDIVGHLSRSSTS